MDDLREFTIDLMRRAPVFYLATVDGEGLPQVRAMENLKCEKKFPQQSKVFSEHEDDPLVSYISTNTSSAKINQLDSDTIVALYYCMPDEYRGVMIRGKVEVCEGYELKKKTWLDSLVQYYPKGYTDPDYTLMKVKPDWIKAWYSGVHEIRV